MNEGIPDAEGLDLKIDITNPPGQRVVWNGDGQDERPSHQLQRGRAYKVAGIQIFTSGGVYLKLEALPDVWFSAKRFTEYSGD